MLRKNIKKAIRIISFAKTKYEHTPPLFKRNKILPFHEHIQLRRACFMWKIQNDYIHPPVCSIFKKNPYNQKYILPHVKCEKEKNAFEYKCVKAWQIVPENIKSSSTLDSFTLRYKNHLLDDIYTDNDNNNRTFNNHNLAIQNNSNINTRNNRLTRNNYYGQLRHDRPRPRWESRWDNIYIYLMFNMGIWYCHNLIRHK